MIKRFWFYYIAIQLMILIPAFASGQFLKLMRQELPNIDRHTIRTSQYRLIFPAEITDQAQQLANILEQSYAPTAKSLNVKPKRITIVLHNHTTISNAMVYYQPRKSDFYTMPPQDTDMEWINSIAVHELRHVAQHAASKYGITALLSYIIGDASHGPVAATVPNWFSEGDAVVIETALTRGGRGRLPGFETAIKTILAENGLYDYDVAVLPSYNNWFPSHYHLGYLLVAYLRHTYGEDVIKKIYAKAGSWPFSPIAFSMVVKSITGKSVEMLYLDAMKELNSRWVEQIADLQISNARIITNSHHENYTNYKMPHFLSDGSIIALKSSQDDIACFTIIDTLGHEQKIHTPGYLPPGTISCTNDILIWSEFAWDIRWGFRDYAVIKMLDTQTGETKQITHKSRLFSPALSKDAKLIVAVKVSDVNSYSLVIIDAVSGEQT